MALTITFVFVLVLSCLADSKNISKKPSGPTTVNEVGAVEVLGVGAAIADHNATITVVGGPGVPAILQIHTGSGVGLSQQANNVQISQINADGSSTANQLNTGANSAYAYETLTGNAQGLDLEVISNGWSAVEGEGTVAQADQLDHQQGSGGQNESTSGNYGWNKNLKPVNLVA